MVDLSALTTEDLLALKGGDLSKVSTAGLQALKGMSAPSMSAAERVASDPITQGAQKVINTTGPELLAGSAPGRFLLQPARGLLELGSQYIPGANKPIEIGNLRIPGAAEAVKSTDELIKAGREAYGNTGMDIAGAAGSVASPAVLKAAKLVPAAGMFSRMGGSALTGATAGAVTPTEGKGDFATEKALQIGTGTAFGAALPPAGALMKGLGKTIYGAFEPVLPGGPEAILRRFQDNLVGPAKDKIVNALMAAKELIPGSKPTAGEALAGLPEATGLAAHQAVVRKAPPASVGFVQREGQQEAARAGALESVAGSAPVPPMYARRVGAIDPEGAHFSTRGGTYFDPQKATKSYDLGKVRIADLTEGPALKDALDSLQKQGYITTEEHADHLANGMSYLEAESLPMKDTLSKLGYGGYRVSEHGDFPGQASTVFAWDTKNITPWLPIAGRPTRTLAEAESARSAQAASDYNTAFAETVKRDKELSQLSKDPFFKAALPDAKRLAKSKEITAKDDLTQFLDYVKVGLDKQLSRTGDTALAGKEKEAVQSVKNRLLAWMDEKNPAYAIARENFAQASRPINQMQAGQFLQQKLQGPLPLEGGGHIERAAGFAQAIRDAEGTMTKATGYESKLPEPLRKVSDAIAMDLGRKAQFERLARGTNLGGASMTPESLLPNLLSRPAMLTNYIAKKLGHSLEDRVSKVAGEQYLDPAKLAAALKDIPPSKLRSITDAILGQVGLPIVAGGPSAAIAQHY